MNKTNIKDLIRQYLREAKLMQLATSIDDQPWVCSVWFASDEDLNIYWFSSITRRHSNEVTKNHKVAGAIALPHTPQDKPRGLQFQGIAKELSNEKDIEKAIALFTDRIFPRELILKLIDSRDFPHRFYRISPTQFVLFDAVNFPDNSRREYNL